MPNFRLDILDPLPSQVTAFVVEYETKGKLYPIGKFNPATSLNLVIPDEAEAVVLTPIGSVFAKSTRAPVNSQALITTQSVATPEPILTADPLKDTINVTATADDGHYLEVRTSASGLPVEQAMNSPQIQFVSMLNVKQQTVYVRQVRDEDGAVSEWASGTMVVDEVPEEMQEYEDTAGVSGYAVEEFHASEPLASFSGTTLVFNSGLPIEDYAFVTGPFISGMTDATGPYLDEMIGVHHPQVALTTPWIAESGLHDFLPRSILQFGAVNRHADSGLIDPSGSDTMGWPLFFELNERTPCLPNDPMLHPGIVNDDIGVTTDDEIQLMDENGASGSFEPLKPGHRYRAKAYRLRKTLHNPLGGWQFNIEKWHRSKLLRNRKWEYRSTFAYAGSGYIEIPLTFTPVRVVSATASIEPVADTAFTASVQYQSLTNRLRIYPRMQTQGTSTTEPIGGVGSGLFTHAFFYTPTVIPHGQTSQDFTYTAQTGRVDFTAIPPAARNIDWTAHGIPANTGLFVHVVMNYH